MRYKTKPFTIEAVQWFPKDIYTERVLAAFDKWAIDFRVTKNVLGEVEKAIVYDYIQDTFVNVNPGDYIIKGSENEFYPCASKVFEAKYEPMLIEAAIGAVDEGQTDFGCFKVSDD